MSQPRTISTSTIELLRVAAFCAGVRCARVAGLLESPRMLIQWKSHDLSRGSSLCVLSTRVLLALEVTVHLRRSDGVLSGVPIDPPFGLYVV